jgi:UDP-N-acetylmuramoyl-L-alanyl-D-glutamate--2,6-diaminopimelate ligase
VSKTVRPTEVSAVSLREIAALAGSDSDVPDLAVTGVTAASSSVRPGDLYVGVPGARTHGARYSLAAAQSGAVAVLTDRQGSNMAAEAGLPALVVEDPRRVVGKVSALVYGHPAEALRLIGVTGTQGKTTTTQLIGAAAAHAGRRTAVIGTMGTRIDGQLVGSALTTPEAPDLHALFAVMRERSIDLCAMEVSSHAVVMGRVDGVVFDLAVFLNLGRDHLDFHADVDEYFAAKAQLFTPVRARRALVNVDDAYGRRLADARQIPTQTFATSTTRADWRGEIDLARSSPHGSAFDLTSPDGVVAHCAVGMAGAFNVSNAVAALAAASTVGVDLAAAAAGVATLGSVAGRMEQISHGRDFHVIVDYAHKPDAVEATLDALRLVTTGRVIIVLGAGGDRDAGKRSLMGEIAATMADVVIVTDDNPRSEDPAQIRAQVISGARSASGDAEVVEIGDRRGAIRYALTSAQPGDTVLVAGKGHETGQEIKGEVFEFDDRRVARDILDELGKVAET